MENDIVKLVYFDEGSATDYIQIESGGELSNVMTLLDEDSSSGEGSANASFKIKGKLLKALLGLDTSAGVEGSLETSFKSGTMVKSIISNTMLTDFLDAVDTTSKANKKKPKQGEHSIRQFSGLRIEQIPGSLSSMALFTPYLTMLRGGQGVAAGDLDISLDKLDSTLSKAKGYLEFIGCADEEGETKDALKVILRFNSTAFKNNYRPSDLLKMDLRLYAVKVGSARSDSFVVDNELSIEGFTSKDNPDYSMKQESSEEEGAEILDMYDVILAGVVKNG